MAIKDLFNNREDTDLPEELIRYLQFELEYYKNTKWEVNEEQLKVYVNCCKAMELIAKYNKGYVLESLWIKPDNILSEVGPKNAVCTIEVPCLCLDMDSFRLFQGVLSQSRCIDIAPTKDEMVRICVEIPNVYVDKGITILENNDDTEVE